jgi:hypothetical protein
LVSHAPSPPLILLAANKNICVLPHPRMGDGIADKVTQEAEGHEGAGAGAGARTAAEFRAGATRVATPWAGEAGGGVGARARVGTTRTGRVTQALGSREGKEPGRGRGRRGERMDPRQQAGPGAGAGGKRGTAGVPVWIGGCCPNMLGGGHVHGVLVYWDCVKVHELSTIVLKSTSSCVSASAGRCCARRRCQDGHRERWRGWSWTWTRRPDAWPRRARQGVVSRRRHDGHACCALRTRRPRRPGVRQLRPAWLVEPCPSSVPGEP